MKFLMLESFFFITLGISCVLLLMLIYHFKQRLSKLEQNNETMFEILNNIVQELSEMKNHNVSEMQNKFVNQKINVNLDDDDLPDLVTNNETNRFQHTLVLSSDEDDDSDEDADTIEDEDSDEDEDSVEDEDIIHNEEDIKTVSVDIDNSLDEIEQFEPNNSEVSENYDNENLEEVALNTEEIDNIKVNKLAEDVNDLEESNLLDSDVINKDVYKKMTVPTLKALVIEKGLATETNKLKKNDLIELLESNA